uniref:Uncharacterized protein n=1 Tax=Timema cristinae TaxID=61476 RepID=A0A7R9CFZ2_TIMCR|nr:unnamed protein product [Timema cristinae]
MLQLLSSGIGHGKIPSARLTTHVCDQRRGVVSRRRGIQRFPRYVSWSPVVGRECGARLENGCQCVSLEVINAQPKPLDLESLEDNNFNIGFNFDSH